MKFPDKIQQRTDGVTLVEVMMAAVVMVAAIVGMLQVLTSGSEMLDVSRKQTIATQIIRFEIDKLHLENWTTVSAYSTSAAGTVLTVDTSFSTVASGFTIRRYVSVVRTDMRKITFTVAWRGNTGRSYLRTGTTYFGKNGLYVTYQRT